MWTLVLIWYPGWAEGQNVVIPGFSSRETCQAAAEQIKADIGYTNVAKFVLCVEVK